MTKRTGGGTIRTIAVAASLLAAAPLLASCELGVAAGGLMVETVLPAAHVDTPFNAGLNGEVGEVNFHVPRRGLYVFTLNYQYRENDKQDQIRVRKLVQGIDLESYPIRDLNDGLSILVRLSISRDGEAQVWSVRDETLTRQTTEGYSATDVSRVITQIVLAPGRYHARVEALQDTPGLQGIHVRFSAHGRGG